MDMPSHIRGRGTYQLGQKRLSLWVCRRLASAAFQLLPDAAASRGKLRLAGYPSAEQTDLTLAHRKRL